MNIYLITRTDPIGYDEAAGFVIVAESEERVRALAEEHGGDETGWESVDFTVGNVGEHPTVHTASKCVWATATVKLLGPAIADEESIVLRDYRAA